MKKITALFILVLIFAVNAEILAAPEIETQIALIASEKNLWQQEIDFGTWGYAVTDLDHNGRLEVISCSVQGTGFYSYIKAYEVNESGTGLTDLMGDLGMRTDSSPDILVNEVPVYYDKDADRYYYIFDDYIRNGMAEYYENKRAVSILDGKWTEKLLASKSAVYTDEDHYTVSCQDQSGSPISEEQYNSIEQTIYGRLERTGMCFNWIMTEKESFEALSPDQLAGSLRSALDSACPNS